VEGIHLNVNHDVLKKRLKKAFRNSIYKFRVKVRGFRLRSMKEAEVLNLLLSKHISFKYEKEIPGFYPDFFIPANLIIEVVGLEWQSRIKKLLHKFDILINMDMN